MPMLDPDDLRAYARRDWAATERATRRARAQLPVADKVRLSIELYEGARATRPDWPTDADRRADLEAHLRLKKRLQRAAHVGRR